MVFLVRSIHVVHHTMSDTQSQHGEEEFGEDSTPIVPLPYFWKLITDQSENPNLEQLVVDPRKEQDAKQHYPPEKAPAEQPRSSASRACADQRIACGSSFGVRGLHHCGVRVLSVF